jgi:UDP-N-acetylglucosamine diphosphorylase/glucosamine-1-phosphate N-acetyltransferase
MAMRYITKDSMTNTVLFDFNRKQLLPFTFTRPVADIRIGILTIRQHWELLLEQPTSFFTEDYLSKKFPVWKEKENLFLNGALIPDIKIIEASRGLMLGQRLVSNGIPLAAFAEGWPDPVSPYGRFTDIEYKGKITIINNCWDIFLLNDLVLRQQFKLLTEGRKSRPISLSNRIIAPENIFIEQGATVECAMINASTGPVYIGKNAEVMEGSMIRGPFSLGDHATLKMGAKIYGATTIGPHCKVGGEVTNSVMFGYTNKAHDGFLGNSVIGEWCNLGADSNNSNLKNNYSDVQVFSYATGANVNSGIKFCGLFMGDHSKCGINTMFNTGTVTGVSANIFGAGFPPKFIPSFSWGGFDNSPMFVYEKAAALAKQVFNRRGIDFDATEEALLKTVFDMTKSGQI